MGRYRSKELKDRPILNLSNFRSARNKKAQLLLYIVYYITFTVILYTVFIGLAVKFRELNKAFAIVRNSL